MTFDLRLLTNKVPHIGLISNHFLIELKNLSVLNV
jgi:hypothetical protein